MTNPNHVPTARDIMTHTLVAFRPDAPIFEPASRRSGAPYRLDCVARAVSGYSLKEFVRQQVGW